MSERSRLLILTGSVREGRFGPVVASWVADRAREHVEARHIQRLGDTWSLFFRDPDGMELEVCTRVEEP